MPQNIHCSFNAASRIHLALTVVAALAFLTWVPSRVRAQDTSPTQTTANTETVGERLRRATDSQEKIADFAVNTGALDLAKILNGDWVMLSMKQDMAAQELKSVCESYRVNLKQPDPHIPILEGQIGKEGYWRRFELRLSAAAKMSWISNIQDEIHVLGYGADTTALGNMLNRVIEYSVTQGQIIPINNDVVSVLNLETADVTDFLVRCPSEQEDRTRTEQNIQTVNGIKDRVARQVAISSYAEDGSVGFVSKMQGSWTLIDQKSNTEIEAKTINEACRIRRIEMRWDQKPLPILTSHVVDRSSDQERPVPASQDEFELRLAGERELLRVASHDPLASIKSELEKFRVPAASEFDFEAKQSKEAIISNYRNAILSQVLPVSLVAVDEDTYIEVVIPWNYPFNHVTRPANFKRYWFRCPEEARENQSN